METRTNEYFLSISSEEYRILMEKEFPNLYWEMVEKLSPSQSCMAWGFEVNVGWRKLIYDLSTKLEPLVAKLGKDYGAQQVKEKFGTLRFYINGNTEINNLVNEAQELSSTTCEVCGESGKLYSSGWWRTLCEHHEAGRNQKLEQADT